MSSIIPDSQGLQRFVARWWPRLALIVFLAMILYVVFGKQGGIIRVMELKSENDRLKSELQTLMLEKDELEDQIQRLEHNDPVLIEEEARRKGMVREGETVYRLRYKEVPDTAQTGKHKDNPGGR